MSDELSSWVWGFRANVVDLNFCIEFSSVHLPQNPQP